MHGAGGAVEGVGGLPQDPATQHRRGSVQGVPGRRAGAAHGAHVRRGGGGGLRGVLPGRAALSISEPGRVPVPAHRWRGLGQVRSAASFPPPY
jgi:hypothetical protein